MAITKAEATERANKLIEWISKQIIPETGVKIKKWATIVHTPTYIQINKDRLTDCGPLSKCWMVGYMALYELKKLIENDYQL